MSHTPRIQVHYRVATSGEIRNGRTVDIRDTPDGQAVILLHPGETREPMPAQFTQLSSHHIVHGIWRQRWTDEERMTSPAQGLRVGISRWETAPSAMMPAEQIVVPVEHDRSCVWVIDEAYCTPRLLGDMNDLLLRLAGDGLWIQCWFPRRPRTALGALTPLAPSAVPLLPV
jgi:hypothetical protein